MSVISEDICLTPYHPICVPDKNNKKKWYFPINIEGAENIMCDYYYNFVLDNGGTLVCGLDRLEVCTLGLWTTRTCIGTSFLWLWRCK